MCGRFIIEPDSEEHFFEHFGAELAFDIAAVADSPIGVPEVAAATMRTGFFDPPVMKSPNPGEANKGQSLSGTLKPRRLFPRYNITPTQMVPIIRASAAISGIRITKPRGVTMAHWGLIPGWAKDRSIAARMINARSETAAEKPSFRTALSRRRCIVPATGFYEWKAIEGRKTKQPYLIGRSDGAPLAFAALWETWKDREAGDVVESCTILTTEANTFMRQIHDRMPVILRPEHFDAWLDPDAGTEAATALFRQAEPGELCGHGVSTKVSSVKNHGPECREPDPSAPPLEVC